MAAWSSVASTGLRQMGDAIRTRVPALPRAAGAGGGKAASSADDLGRDEWQGGQRPPSSVPPSALPRVVLLNAREDNRRAGFPRNYVSTTKYTWLSAAPTFLFEQLTRFSNAYFIFVGILYLFDSISPVNTAGRYASLYSVGVVVAIAAVREAVEELRRYKEDRRVNRDAAHVLGVGSCTWADVRVGDMVRVLKDQPFPADLVLLATSDDDGVAYVETKQLDGESNLKVKLVLPDLALRFENDEASLAAAGAITCEPPNDRLYRFAGSITVENPLVDEDDPAMAHCALHDDGSMTLPLGPEQLFIRGSTLRNTEWVMAVVVATGRDTKLLRNNKTRPIKRSQLERSTNIHYFVPLVLQIVIVIVLTIAQVRSCRLKFMERDAWYLLYRPGEECPSSAAVLRVFTFFCTFSGLIPISLYVTVEIVRGFQVALVQADEAMMYETTAPVRPLSSSEATVEASGSAASGCTPRRGKWQRADAAADVAERTQTVKLFAEVRTSSLNEEVGVVSYVLTDKTGTLTANMMEFRQLAVNESVLSAAELGELVSPANLPPPNASVDSMGGDADTAQAMRALRLLALCHSVVPDVAPDGTVLMQASSPDEAALVAAATAAGVQFVARNSRSLRIHVHGRVEEYELLAALEFDSTRKRMSVILRCPDGRARVYCKGADAVIFERLAAPSREAVIATANRHLHTFAVEGLRTLCLAVGEVAESRLESWLARYRLALGSSTTDREAVQARLADEMERDLTFVGTTAVEDRLQDGVPATLRALERAGVRVWMMTGDKLETALNIGLSCGLLNDDMDVIVLSESDLEGTTAQIDRALGRWSALLADGWEPQRFGLVIDGGTLHWALLPHLQHKLMLLGRSARSLIACRVSPKQKTEMVELVRRHDPGKVTLAIGDGANDVGMIQAAHVGVGLVGLEGKEAKLASDFAIGQFRFLARLMFVHGRWNYTRVARMVLFVIYKNIVLVLCELFWAPYAAFTGQPLFDPWIGSMYNLCLTTLLPIFMGILDQELSSPYALMFPEVYRRGHSNSAYSFRVFLGWLASGVWQSAVIFYFATAVIGDGATASGRHLGVWNLSLIVYSTAVMAVHAMVVVYVASWTVLSAFLFFVSFCSWFVIGPLLTTRGPSITSGLSPSLFWAVQLMYQQPVSWLFTFVVVFICVLPNLTYHAVKRVWFPNFKHLVQELQRRGIVGDADNVLSAADGEHHRGRLLACLGIADPGSSYSGHGDVPLKATRQSSSVCGKAAAHRMSARGEADPYWEDENGGARPHGPCGTDPAAAGADSFSGIRVGAVGGTAPGAAAGVPAVDSGTPAPGRPSGGGTLQLMRREGLLRFTGFNFDGDLLSSRAGLHLAPLLAHSEAEADRWRLRRARMRHLRRAGSDTQLDVGGVRSNVLQPVTRRSRALPRLSGAVAGTASGSARSPTTPWGSAGVPTTPRGSAATPSAPRGSAAAPTTPRGSAAAPTTPRFRPHVGSTALARSLSDSRVLGDSVANRFIPDSGGGGGGGGDGVRSPRSARRAEMARLIEWARQMRAAAGSANWADTAAAAAGPPDPSLPLDVEAVVVVDPLYRDNGLGGGGAPLGHLAPLILSDDDGAPGDGGGGAPLTRRQRRRLQHARHRTLHTPAPPPPGGCRPPLAMTPIAARALRPPRRPDPPGAAAPATTWP